MKVPRLHRARKGSPMIIPWRKGDKVFHAKLGQGTVVEVWPKAKQYAVDFQHHRQWVKFGHEWQYDTVEDREIARTTAFKPFQRKEFHDPKRRIDRPITADEQISFHYWLTEGELERAIS